jgi:hypothetical protein
MFARGKRHRGSFERSQKSAYGLELGEVDQSLKGSTFLWSANCSPQGLAPSSAGVTSDGSSRCVDSAVLWNTADGILTEARAAYAKTSVSVDVAEQLVEFTGNRRSV